MSRRRYEFTEREWSIIVPLLPCKPRGVPRVDDRMVLNGVMWRFRTGSSWSEISERYGVAATCYNRFVRWRRAGVWDRLLEAVSEAYNSDIVMIDSTCVRVHQHEATGKKGMPTMVAWEFPWRLTSKIHAIVDAEGRQINLCLTGSQVFDCSQAEGLMACIKEGGTLLADKAYYTDAIRKMAGRKIWANIPPKSSHKGVFAFSTWVYRRRNLVKRFFNRIKYYRGISTRYDKIPDNFLAAIKLIAFRIWCISL
ncbi:IS5 family transposase [Brucella intermedia]|uniref:IS5 family transposase n=1 Tax=Brucella intermedia TaxID=94625 RepID=UPI00124E0A8E|nr:IS5 family transposase [Brucella intermedia]KAB2721506.1 IS5 family transposase [Brucella intermedia]